MGWLELALILLPSIAALFSLLWYHTPTHCSCSVIWKCLLSALLSSSRPEQIFSKHEKTHYSKSRIMRSPLLSTPAGTKFAESDEEMKGKSSGKLNKGLGPLVLGQTLFFLVISIRGCCVVIFLSRITLGLLGALCLLVFFFTRLLSI